LSDSHNLLQVMCCGIRAKEVYYYHHYNHHYYYYYYFYFYLLLLLLLPLPPTCIRGHVSISRESSKPKGKGTPIVPVGP